MHFADDQFILSKDEDDIRYMARKLDKEYDSRTITKIMTSSHKRKKGITVHFAKKIVLLQNKPLFFIVSPALNPIHIYKSKFTLLTCRQTCLEI